MNIIKKMFIRNVIGAGEKGDKGIGKKAKDNKSGLCGFYYGYDGTIGRNNYSYDIKKQDGVTVFEYKSLEHEDLGEMKKTVGDGLCEKLNEIYLEYRVAEWDGFSRYNTEICDGAGFSLSLYFNDGKSVYAHGSNAYPERYRDFIDKVKSLLDPLRDELLEEARAKKIEGGINGKLQSVLFCIHQYGSFGSDEYKFMIMRQSIRNDNFEVKVKAPSLEFFPEKEVSVYTSAPDDKIPFDKMQEIIEKYDLVKWYGYDKHSEDSANREWFQISFGFDDGFHLNAMGSKPPENYCEFRNEFIKLIAETAKNVKI